MTNLEYLIRQNNVMLKFICNYIIEKEQVQDIKDYINNVAADMYVEGLTRK